MRLSLPVSLACLLLIAVPAVALGHTERAAQYPPQPSKRTGPPKVRAGGKTLVVCKANSKARIKKRLHGARERRNLRYLKACHFRNIESAVKKAKSNYRILVLPGVYREEPSRKVPYNDPKCASLMTKSSDGHEVPSYAYTLKCPTSRNLIAVVGDTNGDRRCDKRCNLQILGTGAKAADVYIVGSRKKSNVIRGDRADGLVIRNLRADFADENAIYVMETDGFRLEKLVTTRARRYGVLTFTSDHGLYNTIVSTGNGDSGVYPGSGGPGDCQRKAIEIKHVNSYGNIMGYSGTAGDNVWVHDNRFHHNGAGIITDSFASGHPGMPQRCAKWENNKIYSNNFNPYTDDRDVYCKNTPYEKRKLDKPCPTFQVPVGTGGLIAGGNKNVVRNNIVWDNWRRGFQLFHVPAVFRNEPDKGIDTSFDNVFATNRMGVTPGGKRAPNGVDFWWDEQGKGNCWTSNTTATGFSITSDPVKPLLPDCPDPSPVARPGNGGKLAGEAACVTWDPDTNPNPPGCLWFTTPPKPSS